MAWQVLVAQALFRDCLVCRGGGAGENDVRPQRFSQVAGSTLKRSSRPPLEMTVGTTLQKLALGWYQRQSIRHAYRSHARRGADVKGAVVSGMRQDHAAGEFRTE